MKRLVIIGAGGLAQEVLWIVDDLNARLMQWEFLGFIDEKPANNQSRTHYGRPVIDGWGNCPSGSEIYFACGIGSPEARERTCRHAERLGLKPATLVHPSVIFARYVEIGEGTVIAAGTILAPYASVGRHCLLNIGVTVGHDTHIGDYCVLSPGAQLLGAAELREKVVLGANATVYPGRTVGAQSVVGANSFLVSNLGERQSVVGVPAAKLAHRSTEESSTRKRESQVAPFPRPTKCVGEESSSD